MSDLIFTTQAASSATPGAGQLVLYSKTADKQLYIKNDAGTESQLLTAGAVLSADLLFTDATYDIGKSGATRPRDGFFSRNLTVGGTLAVDGTTSLDSHLLFTDATYDIGASGATRPRDLYLSRDAVIGGDIKQAATKKHYLDGGSNTYIHEVSADVISFVAGGTERARFNATGFLKLADDGVYGASTSARHEINTGSANTTTSAVIITAFSSSYAGTVQVVQSSSTTTNSTYNLASFQNGNASGLMTVRDSGNVINTNNSYGSASGLKLKMRVQKASSQLDDISALGKALVNYKLRNFGSKKHLGLIAEEVLSVSPGLVECFADRDLDGNLTGSITYSVNYSIAALKNIKATGELIDWRNEELVPKLAQIEQRLAALETRP